MNIEESIIDTTEICQVNDGLRFQYDPAKNILKPVVSGKSGSFAYNGSETDATWFTTDNILFETEDGRDSRDFDLGKSIDLSGFKNGYLLARTEDVRAETANLFEYDDDGNVEVVRDRSHRILGEFTYDGAGNILTHTDGTGNTRSFTYDDLNRMLTATDGDGGVVRYAYDGMGNLLSVTDQRGKTTRFRYDVMDRVVERTDPDGNAETYSYDRNGNMVERTDRNGNAIAYMYDVLDRLISEIWSDGTHLGFAYDPAGNMIEATAPGATNTFVYDGGNRVVEAVAGGVIPEVSIFYAYDRNGNLSRMEDTELRSGIVNHLRDENDNLVRLRVESPTFFGSVVASELVMDYDGSQRRERVGYPNGVTGGYRYEAGKQSRIRELSYTRGSDVISSFKYSHDLNDFVTKVETVRSGITVNRTQTYTYDKRNQLTSATRPMGTGSETFTYDSTGNRLQRDGETTDSTFDDVNRLLSDKKFTYEYDNNGNMTKKTGTDTGEVAQFAWDYRNRLVGVVIKPGENANPTSTISYRYDAFNRRIEKNVNGTITRYVYDRGNIHLEYDGNNTFQAKYVHTDNVDEAVMMIRPDNPYKNDKFPVQEFYYHRDRLGNITEITDFEGTVVQRYVYDVFGKVSIFDKDGNAITPESAKYLKSPYAFTGREYDPETGCYYYRARYYCPETSRFLSEDPALKKPRLNSTPQTFDYNPSANDLGKTLLSHNLYTYANNSPLNFIDPDGRLPNPVFVGAGIAGSYCIYLLINKGVEKTRVKQCQSASGGSEQTEEVKQCKEKAKGKPFYDNLGDMFDEFKK